MELTAMERGVENQLEKLLHGHAKGCTVALRACEGSLVAAVKARFGAGSVFQIAFSEPCRAEHPHSAFLRKAVENQGRPATQTTLFAPGGKLTEERDADGQAFEYFIKKHTDFEMLRGFLKDMELHPCRNSARDAAVTPIAHMGLTPPRDMEVRWAGPDMTAWAMMTQDESAASCLRKLERLFHRRSEEAVKLGCHAAVLKDMAALPLPETYMIYAGRHIEWMRHAGLSPYVEVSSPNAPLILALDAARAGARIDLANPALYGEDFQPPEGMKFMFDFTAADGLAGLEGSAVKEMAGKCCSAVFVVDCFNAGAEDTMKVVEGLLESIVSR